MARPSAGRAKSNNVLTKITIRGKTSFANFLKKVREFKKLQGRDPEICVVQGSFVCAMSGREVAINYPADYAVYPLYFKVGSLVGAQLAGKNNTRKNYLRVKLGKESYGAGEVSGLAY